MLTAMDIALLYIYIPKVKLFFIFIFKAIKISATHITLVWALDNRK